MTSEERATAKAADKYEDHILTKVTEGEDWYTLEFDGFGFGMEKANANGIIPKVGDVIRQYPGGWGSRIRGVDINGQEAYYRTEDEQHELNRAEQRERDRKKELAFEAERTERDRRIAALPAPFWRRFERFRRNNPRFRFDEEPYELMCSEQALLLSTRLCLEATEPVTEETFRTFARLPYDE